MHFEVLVEDESGKRMLDVLIPRIIGAEHTFKVVPYKGIGHIPKGLTGKVDASKRMLLDRLPNLLRGYGKAWQGYPAAVIVVCDLDERCLKAFRAELLALLDACHPAPDTRFCIAIEEGEAWLLGDPAAVRRAYPQVREGVLRDYQNDTVCGTWELLADALYRGGAARLKAQGFQAIGLEKSRWAEAIGPHMDVDVNVSPSFRYFRGKLRELAGLAP